MHIPARKENSFLSYNKSTFNSVHFDAILSHAIPKTNICSSKNEKAEAFHIPHFIGGPLYFQVMARHRQECDCTPALTICQ